MKMFQILLAIMLAFSSSTTVFNMDVGGAAAGGSAGAASVDTETEALFPTIKPKKKHFPREMTDHWLAPYVIFTWPNLNLLSAYSQANVDKIFLHADDQMLECCQDLLRRFEEAPYNKKNTQQFIEIVLTELFGGECADHSLKPSIVAQSLFRFLEQQVPGFVGKTPLGGGPENGLLTCAHTFFAVWFFLTAQGFYDCEAISLASLFAYTQGLRDGVCPVIWTTKAQTNLTKFREAYNSIASQLGAFERYRTAVVKLYQRMAEMCDTARGVIPNEKYSYEDDCFSLDCREPEIPKTFEIAYLKGIHCSFLPSMPEDSTLTQEEFRGEMALNGDERKRVPLSHLDYRSSILVSVSDEGELEVIARDAQSLFSELVEDAEMITTQLKVYLKRNRITALTSAASKKVCITGFISLMLAAVRKPCYYDLRSVCDVSSIVESVFFLEVAAALNIRSAQLFFPLTPAELAALERCIIARDESLRDTPQAERFSYELGLGLIQSIIPGWISDITGVDDPSARNSARLEAAANEWIRINAVSSSSDSEDSTSSDEELECVDAATPVGVSPARQGWSPMTPIDEVRHESADSQMSEEENSVCSRISSIRGENVL